MDDITKNSDSLSQSSQGSVTDDGAISAKDDKSRKSVPPREALTQRKQIFERQIFNFNESMPSGHWAVPWSDLMMVVFVLFAVLYSYVLSHRNLGEAFKLPPKNVPSKSSMKEISKFQEISNDFTEIPKKHKTGSNISQEDLYAMLQNTFKVENLEEVTLMLDQDKTIKVSISEPMLFDPGRADLKPASIMFLRRFSEVILKTKYKVVVEGHTDSFPIHNENFPTNWELSAMRAIQVARFLIEDSGLEPERFSIVGYSLYKPLVPNSSLENKAKNRRVEIIITREKIA